MKQLTTSLLCLTLGTPLAQALVNLGEGEIMLDVTADIYYDSRITARANGEGDFVFSGGPALVYTRASKNFTFSASAGVNVIRYLDSNGKDDENFLFDVSLDPNAEREYSRFTFSGGLILNSETRSEDSVGDIVTTRNYGANGQVVYDPNQNFNIVGNASFTRRDPQEDIYDEVDSTEAGLKIQVPVNQRLLAEAGAGYGKTDSENDAGDSETYTYFVGFSGAVTPKLAGNLSVGLQQRDFDDGNSEDSPYASASLSWTIDERSQAVATLSRGFDTSINSQSTETTSLDVTISRDLRRDLSANAYAGYAKDDFRGLGLIQSRDDEEVYIGAGISYQFVRWGSLGFDVRYTDQRSSLDQFEYDRVRAGITFRGSW